MSRGENPTQRRPRPSDDRFQRRVVRDASLAGCNACGRPEEVVRRSTENAATQTNGSGCYVLKGRQRVLLHGMQNGVHWMRAGRPATARLIDEPEPALLATPRTRSADVLFSATTTTTTRSSSHGATWRVCGGRRPKTR